MCSALDVTQLADLSKQTRKSRHHPGDELVGESTEVVGYANVVRGVVKLSKVLDDGRQQLVGLQFAPDMLGRLYGTEHLITAEAASDVELCRVPKSSLEGLVAGNPALQQHVLRQTLRELDEAREWMVTLGRKSAAERVSSLLCLIASRADPAQMRNQAGTVSLDLPLSRADIADFLGLTIETVSRQMTKLRRDGMIRIVNHRRIEVTDLKQLRCRCG